jgi:hypothetical protein
LCSCAVIVSALVSTTGSGADNPTLEKTLVTKCEEAIAGYFSWQKFLRKARAHWGCRANDDDDDDDDESTTALIPRLGKPNLFNSVE